MSQTSRFNYFTSTNASGTIRSTVNPSTQYLPDEAWLEERLQAHRKKYESAAWYNPDDGWIYVGEKAPNKPTWNDRAYNANKYKQMKTLFKQGSIDADALNHSCWSPGYWQDEANEVLKYKNDGTYQLRNPNMMREAAAGAVTSDDNPSIAVIQILAEIMGRDTRTYSLKEVVSHASTPNLSLSVDTWNGFGVSRDVAEGVEALPQKGKFVRQEYLIGKDVSHIFISDEASLRADRDLMQTHISHSGDEMTRVQNLKAAIALESVNSSAGNDWTALDSNGFQSEDDPIADIGVVADLIEDNGGDPNTIASHHNVFRAFLSNTKVHGLVNPGNNLSAGTKIVQSPPGLPMFRWALDNLKTAGRITIFDNRAVLFMQGPVRTGTYRQEGRGGDGYITRDWNRCVVIDPTRVYNRTGLVP